jgi:plasmid stability protein
MKTMTIRNIPDHVYDEIAKGAQAEHRSLQEQVRCILMNDAALRSGSVCEKAAEYRTMLAGRASEKSVVEELQGDRQR